MSSILADWLLFMSFYDRSQEDGSTSVSNNNNNATSDIAYEDLAWNERIKHNVALRLGDLYPDYLVPAFVVSYLFYFGIGGFLHVS